MKTVGEFVQEAVDFINGGAYNAAFAPTCAAVAETTKKIYGHGNYEKFIRQNWELLSFMGLPRALPLPLNVPFALKRIVPSFSSNHGAMEIVFYIIQQTLATGRMPDEFTFASTDVFEIEQNRLLLPITLLGGLLGVVIVQPVNREETIDEKYWMNIADFKMFISELWGRIDLAERIMKFYLE